MIIFKNCRITGRYSKCFVPQLQIQTAMYPHSIKTKKLFIEIHFQLIMLKILRQHQRHPLQYMSRKNLERDVKTARRRQSRSCTRARMRAVVACTRRRRHCTVTCITSANCHRDSSAPTVTIRHLKTSQ